MKTSILWKICCTCTLAKDLDDGMCTYEKPFDKTTNLWKLFISKMSTYGGGWLAQVVIVGS